MAVWVAKVQRDNRDNNGDGISDMPVAPINGYNPGTVLNLFIFVTLTSAMPVLKNSVSNIIVLYSINI